MARDIKNVYARARHYIPYLLVALVGCAFRALGIPGIEAGLAKVAVSDTRSLHVVLEDLVGEAVLCEPLLHLLQHERGVQARPLERLVPYVAPI